MIVSQTPLRVSFLGGASDFEDFYKDNTGAVLSATIDKAVYVVVKERFDDKIYVNWAKKEIVDRVEGIEHELVRCAMQVVGVDKGVEITTLADVPAEGIGLGSSSSTTVGLLHALHTYCGRLVTAEQLAEQACHIEIEMLGKPIGRQDQTIAAFGNMRLITFSRDGVKVGDVNLKGKANWDLDDNLLLFYTGVTRQSSSVLTSQKARIADNVPVLRELAQLALEGKECLERGEFDRFGELLGVGWELKKRLANEISNPAIDQIYQAAKEAGAIGGKIAGAGAGGCLLLYCPIAKREAVRERLKHLRELPFRFQEDGSKIIFNYRR